MYGKEWATFWNVHCTAISEETNSKYFSESAYCYCRQVFDLTHPVSPKHHGATFCCRRVLQLIQWADGFPQFRSVHGGLLWSTYLCGLLLQELHLSVLEEGEEARDDVLQEGGVLRRRRHILKGGKNKDRDTPVKKC